MKYMCLIYDEEPNFEEITPEMMEAEIGEYVAYGQIIDQAGVSTGIAEALEPSATATTVRMRDGKTLTSDGPFAETKEQIGGFYILDCENLDQAIKYAALIPGAKSGLVEIRPIMMIEA